MRRKLAFHDRPWPTGDGQLVHAAFGLRQWDDKPLPLEERDLPPEFTRLSDDAQAARMAEVLRTVFVWASDHAADRLEVALLEPTDEEASGLGLAPAGPGTLAGPFDAERLLPLLRRSGVERVWITRTNDLLVYMHETWDSVVVTASEDEVADLRSRLADAK